MGVGGRVLPHRRGDCPAESESTHPPPIPERHGVPSGSSEKSGNPGEQCVSQFLTLAFSRPVSLAVLDYRQGKEPSLRAD